MLKVFNKAALTRKQRFTKAIFFGCLATVLITGLNIVLIKVFDLYISFLYLLVGVGIGYCIQYFGKGVQIQFSLLAVGLTLFVILISDAIAYDFAFKDLIYDLTSYGISSLWGLGYRIAGLYLAYRYARVV